MIVYEGVSQLDHRSRIVGVLTGTKSPSHNPKTGPMAQLWILTADVSPVEAVQTGADSSICGDCVHRGPLGERSCYVTVANAPMSVWHRYRRRGYVRTPALHANLILKTATLGVRLGAYGDPAALPVSTLRDLVAGVPWTGYTHAWSRAPAYRDLLMASVESTNQARRATALGWRTFRTQPYADGPLSSNELVCPASAEAGRRTTCDKCHLCNGARRADQRSSIVIAAHGSAAHVYRLHAHRMGAS
jgi:hypothetical protein